MSEENKQMFRRFLNEAFNKRNLAIVDELVDPNILDHSPLPGQVPTLEGLKKGLVSLYAAFPDLHFTVEEVIAEGEMVAARTSCKASKVAKGPSERRLPAGW